MDKDLTRLFQESARSKRRRIESNLEKVIPHFGDDIPVMSGFSNDLSENSVCPDDSESSSVVNEHVEAVLPFSVDIPVKVHDRLLVKHVVSMVMIVLTVSAASSSSESDGDGVTEDNLADKLVGWVHNCNIPSLHVAWLLEILHKYLPSLPKDP